LIAFPCTQCGACCRHVNLSNQTDFLDRGDGICRYHDLTSHLCTIYENRPAVCRVDTYYEQHFKQKISWEQFVHLNLIACEQLDQLE